MASHRGSNDVFDLSLTGSQISTISAGRPGSAGRGGMRRPASASSARNATRDKNPSSTRDKAGLNVVNGFGSARSTGTPTAKSQSRGGSSTSHKNGSASGDIGRTRRGSSSRTVGAEGTGGTSSRKASARDEFMAFFESSTSGASQPKLMHPKQSQRASAGAAAGAGAAPRSAWENDVNSAHNMDDMNFDNDHASQTTANRSKFSHSVFQPLTARTNSTMDDDEEPYNPYSRLHPTHPELSINIGKSPSNEDVNLNSHRSTLREDMNNYTNPIPIPSSRDNRNTAHQDSINKSHKLNSIANNMTSQALSPGNKTPLENAFQNIKHKTPVNQVRQAPMLARASGGSAKNSQQMAATIIQRWIRRTMKRRRAAEAAMKRLLDNKRQEKESQLQQEVVAEKKGPEERKRQREEKARMARQQAIEELHKKRESKRAESARIAEEEVRYLQASGKIKRTPANKSNISRGQGIRKQVNGAEQTSDDDGGPKSNRSSDRSQSNPPTDRTLTRRVDDIFQNNSSHDSHQDADEDDDNEDGGENMLDDPLESGGATGGEDISNAATKTTLNDLMDTLRKLEEEEKFSDSKHGKNQTPQNWLDDLDRHSDDNKSDYLTADKLKRLGKKSVPSEEKERDKDNLRKSTYLTDEKLRSIINFLDEVETADHVSEVVEAELSKANRLSEMDMDIAQANSALLKPALLVPSGEELAQMEQASAAAAEVTNTMLTQKMDLQEKKRTISVLQKALNQQRELTVRHAQETEKEMKKRLLVQKDEYEDAIKRHLSFIDQLIDDKKALSEKCEQLVKEMKTVDKKYSDKIKAITENHDIDIRKLKEMNAAAEKLRREKWIDEKSKKIKEMTVKGLEPEIQRLIGKHKEEIRKMKAIHEAELLASDERAGGRYITMTEQLRDQLAQEKEAACARERELARATYEKQLQQEEEAYQSARRRLHSEVQDEKERLAQQAARQRAEFDKLQRQLEETHSTAGEAMRAEYEKAREEQERRHTTEVRQLREQLAVEKAAWEENYRKKQETWLLTKERELKDVVKKERDKEIEMVIGRLEEDSQTTRDEAERVAENRIKRIRDKYEGEITELERSERQTTEKYNRNKAKLAEFEGENERMKVTLKQKDKEIVELKKLLDRLNEERSRVSEVIRQEFADRLVHTEEENKRLKNEMSEQKARHRIELERSKADVETVMKTKDDEMQEVHKRVKQAIVKKEEVVNQLRAQYEAAVKRADHLEGLLEQQRKQLLGKK